MELDKKFKEFLKNKPTFEDYKEEHYSKFFENRLIKFINENDYKYEEFKVFLNENFNIRFTPEELLNLLIVKSDFNNNIENYVSILGSKYVGIFYLLLEEIPVLHTETLEGLRESYRIYEVELEQEFKWKLKTK